MKSDSELRNDVLAELKWDPMINAADVGVIVKEGVVTLTGHLASFAEKHAAERAVQRVSGVKALAVELAVKLPSSYERTDAEIAAAAERALEWNSMVPAGAVRMMVEKGWITLQGEVEWDYQRRAAESAVRCLYGVTGVTDQLTIKPRANAAGIQRQIQDALVRHASREAKHILVSVDRDRVTLEGSVHSWAERAAAQGAAWATPGVSTVVNLLHVGA